MRYLVISDIHDNLKNLVHALEIARKHNVSKIFFCGDLVSPFVISVIKERLWNDVEFIGVWGNNEGDRDTILMKAQGLTYGKSILLKTFNRLRFLIVHGFEDIGTTEHVIKSLLKSNDYDIILYGHTHRAKVFALNKTKGSIEEYDVLKELKRKDKVDLVFDTRRVSLAINSGELCGYLTGVSTIVIIDVEGEAMIHYIKL